MSALNLHDGIVKSHIEPEQLFLTHKHGELSYGEFQLSVKRMAGWLISQGVKPGDRVALAFPKSVEYVQAIFAVLAAGAAYIPLDAANPVSRLVKIIRTAAPTLVVSTLPQLLEETISQPAVLVENKLNGTALNSLARPEFDGLELPVVNAENLAAVLFTSGSTGQPKGVQLTHGNIGSFVDWAIDVFSIEKNDRLISLAPFHFDLSTLDLFATARAGARVHLIDEATLMFPAAVSLAMSKLGTTICYAAPTVWRMLESHGRLNKIELPSLRLALFAGEVFPIASLRKLMTRLAHPSYYNLYGPTETNVCTYYRLPGIPEEQATAIPLGAACEHLEVMILDEQGKELPAETKGEICVRGPAITPGYLNRPELEDGIRIHGKTDTYRTGDIGLLGSDGMIYYMGRKDNQVKIRGNRIELSEIEGVIGAHPSVVEAVVIYLPGEGDNYQLFACVVGNDPDEAVLLQHCKAHLSQVAVPQSIKFYREFPHTSTGKIDRVRLKSEHNTN